MSRSAVLAVALALAGCSDDAGIVRMMVLATAEPGGAYELREVEIRTLEDVETLRGEAATPIGGAVVDVDPRDFPAVPTEAQFRDTVLKFEGAPVRAQFVERDGVLWPSDYHTLSLATAYHHLERARSYALERGLPAGSLLGLEVYYAPDFRIRSADGEGSAGRNNAGFFTPLRALILFPFHEPEDLPLAVNQAVIAHEYAHAIFHAAVHDAAWIPAYATLWPEDSPGAILLGCLEEGYADAWGAAVSGDLRVHLHAPNIFGDGDRALTEFDPARHCYSDVRFATELDVSRGVGVSAFWGPRQYEVGSVFAMLLVDAGRDPRTSLAQVMDALYASYADGPESLREVLRGDLERDEGGFTFGRLGVPARALVAAADPGTREVLCELVPDRLGLSADELPACAGILAQERCR